LRFSTTLFKESAEGSPFTSAEKEDDGGFIISSLLT
jgi:hypothetical protein